MIEVRRHGDRGPLVVVLHGGPGARGEAAPIARALADRHRVLEPWQRRAGDAPLTVARHVEDLREVVEAEPGGAPFSLVGFSWGAMLALAYAAEHPRGIERVVLVGCGTFDQVARAELRRRRAAHPGRDAHDPLPQADDSGGVDVDEVGGSETWADMLRRQADGTYPARFARIAVPVVMIHGEQDPHPGRMIRDGLRPLIRDLTYVELPRCGHEPWVERHARDAFFASLSEVLGEEVLGEGALGEPPPRA